MDGYKSPGPDGYSAYLFLKACWSIVGLDVCKALKHVFQIQYIPT